MKELSYFNYVIAVLFAASFAYQIGYILVALFRKQKKFEAKTNHRYAVMISARNEEEVIPQLLDSLNWQNYPSELLDLYVVADNCTDQTAKAAAEHGATVYERSDREKLGKGYALDFLYGKITEARGDTYYDGYMIFDADNILDENYVAEINKVFDQGYKAVTSYRNSKNFGDNWISAGYSLYFLRESKFMNNPRMTLGTCCAVSGTGFLVSSEILREEGGWKFFTMTEDTEFTFHMVDKGEVIGYAEDAILYDEQPTSLGQSINQRSRWIKGYLQVFKKYNGKMAKKIVLDGSFAAFDMIANSMPAYFLTLATVLLSAAMFVIGVVTRQDMNIFIYSCVASLVNAYAFLAVLGGITAFSERKRINASGARLVGAVFTFPLFFGTYIFAVLAALFTQVTWKPIKHNASASPAEMKKLTKNR